MSLGGFDQLITVRAAALADATNELANQHYNAKLASRIRVHLADLRDVLAWVEDAADLADARLEDPPSGIHPSGLETST